MWSLGSVGTLARSGVAYVRGMPIIRYDLGTADTLMSIDDGPVWKQPTILLKEGTKEKSRIVGFGDEALPYWECTAENKFTVRPMEDGVPYDHTDVAAFTRMMIDAYMKEHKVKFRGAHPYLLVGTPAEISPTHADALERAMLSIKHIRNLGFIDQALAGGIGAGADVESATGCAIVDMGGGTACIAIISALHHVAKGRRSIPEAGMAMNEAIINAVHDEYGIVIGNPTAEKLKIGLGSAVLISKEDREYPKAMPISKLPTMRSSNRKGTPDHGIEITHGFVYRAMKPVIEAQMRAIKQTLQAVLPEQREKIYAKGLWLVGGSAQTRRYPERIKISVGGMESEVAEEPQHAVLNGMRRASEDLDMFDKVVRHRAGSEFKPRKLSAAKKNVVQETAAVPAYTVTATDIPAVVPRIVAASGKTETSVKPAPLGLREGGTQALPEADSALSIAAQNGHAKVQSGALVGFDPPLQQPTEQA